MLEFELVEDGFNKINFNCKRDVLFKYLIVEEYPYDIMFLLVFHDFVTDKDYYFNCEEDGGYCIFRFINELSVKYSDVDENSDVYFINKRLSVPSYTDDKYVYLDIRAFSTDILQFNYNEEYDELTMYFSLDHGIVQGGYEDDDDFI